MYDELEDDNAEELEIYHATRDGIDWEQIEQEDRLWPWLADDSMSDCYTEDFQF